MTVSLSQVLASARARSAPLAGECAGYLVLAAADHAAQGPRRIEAGSVELHPDGSVRVVGGLPSNEVITERDLRELLDELLLVAGSVTPGLLRAARRRTGTGIDGFVREIETALIPVNRAAARRALARLERETSRAVERGALIVEDRRAGDRLLSPEPPAASPAPPVSFAPPPVSLTPPPPASIVRQPASLTPPPSPASLTPPPASSSSASRPPSDLAPTPVAVPVRAKLARPVPTLEETPSSFETRPETLVARASRAPRKPSEPSAPMAEPAVAVTHVIVSPSAAGPCTPPPPESMTPFLGTAAAQRLSSRVPVPIAVPAVFSSPSPALDDGAELDVPIDVEMPIEQVAAAPLEEVAEDDIVEESPDELTEPFYLDGDDSREPGPLAFHELTALTGSVAPIPETVIELAKSPAPPPEISPDEVIVSAATEVSPEDAIVPAVEVAVPDLSVPQSDEASLDEASVTAAAESSMDESSLEDVSVAAAASLEEPSVAAAEEEPLEEASAASAEEESLEEASVAAAEEESLDKASVAAAEEEPLEEASAASAEEESLEEASAASAEEESLEEASVAAVDEVSSESVMVAAVDEGTREEASVAGVDDAPAFEVVVEQAEPALVPIEDVLAAACPPMPVVPEAELTAAEVSPSDLEPSRGEFDDVELAVLLPSAEPPPVIMRKAVLDPDSLLPRRPLPRQSASNVDELLLSFGHAPSESGEEQDVRSTLKRLAGLEPTPPPGASRD